ncbi:ABC transporter permease [Candidatus Bathyarchaeota archaeon]|nr:ABC transporter permease [Candidatus Bathyarchaeota archaeon]
MKGSHKEKEGRTFEVIKSSLTLPYSLELSMALRNLVRRKIRSILATFGVVIGITTMVTLSAVSNGMSSQMVGWVRSFMGSDLVVTHTDSETFSIQENIPEDLVKRISSIDGVTSLTAELDNAATVGEVRTLVRGIRPVEELRGLTLVEGVNLLESPYDMLVGVDLKRECSLRVGDTVKISSPHSAKEFRVVGVFQSQSSLLDRAVIIRLETAQELFRAKNLVSLILVDVREPKMINEIKRQIEGLTGGVKVIRQDAIIKTIQQGKDLLETFLLSVSSISLIIAGVGIMNTMFMSMVERKREIGILKAIGLSRTQIVKIFLLESILIGVFGGLIGVLLGSIFSKAIEYVSLNYLGTSLFVSLNWGILSFGFILALLCASVFGLYPSWRAASLSPMEALRYE